MQFNWNWLVCWHMQQLNLQLIIIVSVYISIQHRAHDNQTWLQHGFNITCIYTCSKLCMKPIQTKKKYVCFDPIILPPGSHQLAGRLVYYCWFDLDCLLFWSWFCFLGYFCLFVDFVCFCFFSCFVCLFVLILFVSCFYLCFGFELIVCHLYYIWIFIFLFVFFWGGGGK